MCAFAFALCENVQMDAHWDDLKTALALVRHGTLSGAADALGVTYTTVSRRISRLEEALGQVLFERLADGYRPTDAAQLIAAKAAEMEVSQDSLFRQLSAQDGRLSGKLTVTAPQLLIAHVIAPALRIFREKYPLIDLHVLATNDRLDLSRREADVAIRVSNAPGDSLKGLRLTGQDSASFATQEWADRIAEGRDAPLDWILFSGHSDLPKTVREGWPNSKVCYRFDDMIAIGGAAQEGLGIARMPMFLGRKLQGLVQVPCIPPQTYADLWLVAHADVWAGSRVSAFRDVIVPYLREHRALFVA